MGERSDRKSSTRTSIAGGSGFLNPATGQGGATICEEEEQSNSGYRAWQVLS
jgi:hypothetical protein